MKFLIVFLFTLTCNAATFTTLKVGDSAPIDPSATLEVKSTTGAFLVPRMTTTQKNAIPSPTNGDMVYDTTLNAFSAYQQGSWAGFGASVPWGSITGILSNQTDLQSALNLKANLASPTFTGTVTAPTFSGSLSGTATNATNGATLQTSTNAAFYPLFVASSSNGNQLFNLGTLLTFNPSSNTLTATNFIGALTGNSSTATALASTPSGCSTGLYADAISASGNLTCAQVATSQLSGAVTLTQIANQANNTLLGNNSGTTGPPTALTSSSVNTILGDVTTMGSFGSTPNANGGSISSNTLTLQPASSSQPGGVSTTTQTFAGSKTLGTNTSDAITVGAASSTAAHQINGAVAFTTRTIVGNLTVDTTTSDYEILANCSSACTITLPAPTNGRELQIVDINGQSQLNNITVAQHASEKINGVAASYVLAGNAASWAITSDGTNWFVKFNPAPTWAFGGGTDGAISITASNQRGQNVLCVYCAIGQRAAAVAKTIATLREKGAMDYTVLVITEGNDPPGLAYIAPYAATSIAESFMEAGRDVLIVYDDLTHHARAYRELSLLLRRPPGREAFPGDIFYIHSRLLERATHLRKELGGGSLTALPVIETEAQDISAYIPTNLISITDGQIYLSPSLFELGVLPAVDVGKSVSRVGGKAQRAAYRLVAGDLKLAYAQFEELETFSKFGARLDENTRKTIDHGQRIRACLKQPESSPVSVPAQITILLALASKLFDPIPLNKMKEAEEALLKAATEIPPEVSKRLDTAEKLSDEDRETITQIARKCLAGFAPKPVAKPAAIPVAKSETKPTPKPESQEKKS